MELETVVFPQGHFGHGGYTSPWCDTADSLGHWDPLFTSLEQNVGEWEVGSKDPEASRPPHAATGEATGRRKRRRVKSAKNKEEIESQRMTHIVVERNRRRQMNEYLAVLRSLMPPSYAQRGDQASIVGGAINYVKELEQLLQSLLVQKSSNEASPSPFATFFSFPQFSTSPSHGGSDNAVEINAEICRPAVADIEVTVVEGHANLKVLAQRRPKQLLKLVAGLQRLRLPALHLNMTTLDGMVMYSFSLKVEDDSKFSSVDEIAAAVHEILGRILEEEEEAGFS